MGITWCQNCFVPLGSIDKKQNIASQLFNKLLNKVIFDYLLMFYQDFKATSLQKIIMSTVYGLYGYSDDNFKDALPTMCFHSSFCRVATKATKNVKLPSCRTFYTDMNIIQIILKNHVNEIIVKL